MLQRLQIILSGIAETTGKLASWLAVLMVLLQFVIVVWRYGFDDGSIALQEAVIYMHAALFILCAAYAAKHEAHVRVDIFYQRFSVKTKAKIDLFGALILLLPTAVFLCVISFDYVAASWRILEGSGEAGGLDAVYLLKTLIPALGLMLFAQAINQALAACSIIAGKQILISTNDKDGVNV